MPAGLRIFNDVGILQIDDTYQNFFLNQSGYVTTDATGFAEVWISSEKPMIVAAAAYNGATITYQNKIGNSWLYYVRSNIGGDQVKWYAFSDPMQTPFNGGLRVYDANGVITYDSSQKPLVVSYFLDLDAPAPPQIPAAFAPEYPERPTEFYVPLKQGHTYAAFSMSSDPYSIYYKVKYGSGWLVQYDYHIYMPQQRSGGMNFYPKIVWSGSDRVGIGIPIGYRPKATYTWARQQYWIIDVTGY